MMTKNISLCAILLSLLCLFASCMSDDSTTATTYDDAAITSFTLGTFKVKTVSQTSAGNDTTITTSYSGSKYPMCIDQLTHEIYNTDSLPFGTQTKMLATVTSKNSSYVIYQKWSDATDIDSLWRSYSSSDSIVFSEPLRFRVISTDLSLIHDYCVKVSCHAEPEDSFIWYDPINNPDFVGAKTLKGVATSQGLYVLTDKGVFFSSDQTNTWTQLNKDYSQNNAAVPVTGNSIIAKGNDVYVLECMDASRLQAGQRDSLYTITPTTFDAQAVSGIQMLAGSCGPELYAVSPSGLFCVSKDNGLTWTTDGIEKYSDATKVPVDNICFSNQTNSINSSLRTVTVIGTSKAGNSVIWNKTLEMKADGSSTTVDDWTLTTTPVLNKYTLPDLANLSSCGYNKTWLLAIGGDYSQFYVSCQGDNGITWFKESGFKVPEGLSAPALLMSDCEGKYFYLMNPQTGNVYRGKLTNATWTDYDRTIR